MTTSIFKKSAQQCFSYFVQLLTFIRVSLLYVLRAVPKIKFLKMMFVFDSFVLFCIDDFLYFCIWVKLLYRRDHVT